MKTVVEIYKEYKIYQRLQDHMLRVAAVASIICDNLDEQINKEEIVLAALFHDMGNIIKSDLKYFSDFSDIELKYWENVKKEFIKKYGSDETDASVKIMKEIGLPSRSVFLADKDRFSLLCIHAGGKDMDIKIIHYSDNRVSPYGIMSYEDRMEDARKRYESQNKEFEAQRKKLVACGAEIEKQIFARCKIKPEDITDEVIAPIVEKLRNYVIHST